MIGFFGPVFFVAFYWVNSQVFLGGTTRIFCKLQGSEVQIEDPVSNQKVQLHQAILVMNVVQVVMPIGKVRDN